MGGPLTGFRVVEISGLGSVAFAGMLFADLGAEVVRIDRLDQVGVEPRNAMHAAQLGMDDLGRGRRRLAVDLRRPDGIELVLRLCEISDVLVEGLRPGVVDRLGLGPDSIASHNPELVYTHITGWGQDGPLARTAGHEIDFLAVSGALDAMSSGGIAHPPPVGYAGDFPAAMAAVIGALAALLARTTSRRGDEVEAAVLDVTMLTGILDRFLHGEERRGESTLDGGSHFYATYRTADDRWIGFGAVEPAFHVAMLEGLGIDPLTVRQHDRSAWPALRERIAGIVVQRTREEWDAVFAERDACYAPVLTHAEAAEHPQVRARSATVASFTRSRADLPWTSPPPGADTRSVLGLLGYDTGSIDELIGRSVVRQAELR